LIFYNLEDVAATQNNNRNYDDYPPPAIPIIAVAATVIKTTHELIPPFC